MSLPRSGDIQHESGPTVINSASPLIVTNTTANTNTSSGSSHVLPPPPPPPNSKPATPIAVVDDSSSDRPPTKKLRQSTLQQFVSGTGSNNSGGGSNATIAQLHQQITAMEETYKREIHAKNDQISALQRQVQELQNVSQMLRGKLEQVEAHSAVCRNNLRPTMVQYAAQERKQLRKQLYEEQYQIGYVMVQPSMAIGDAGGFTEVWVWGQRYKDIMAMQLSAKKKSDVSQQNKLLEELERDKSVFLKDLRRAYDEDRSKYNTVDVFDRYVLYWLLGESSSREPRLARGAAKELHPTCPT
eukprot:PhF_6_TR27206/c2_g1_i4/m.40015